MNPQDTQSNMTPEEAKAALGNATYFQDQMLSMQNPQPDATSAPTDTPKESQNAPQQTEAQVPQVDIEKELTTLKSDLNEQMKSLRKDMENDVKTQIDSLYQKIKDALTDEQD